MAGGMLIAWGVAFCRGTHPFCAIRALYADLESLHAIARAMDSGQLWLPYCYVTWRPPDIVRFEVAPVRH